MDKMTCHDDILSPAAIAEYFGVSTRTIRNWVKDHVLLPPIGIRRKKYWLRAALTAWLADRAQQTVPFRNTAPKAPARRVGRPRLST